MGKGPTSAYVGVERKDKGGDVTWGQIMRAGTAGLSPGSGLLAPALPALGGLLSSQCLSLPSFDI